MKRNILYLALLLCSISLFAAERTEEQMKNAARSALSKTISKKSNRAEGVPSELKLMKSLSKLSVYGYADGGFAVISKDDRYSEVIGYSDTRYSDSIMPCGFKWWMEAINSAMAVEGNVTLKGRYAQRRAAGSKVEPMVKTKWDQSEPYNRLCTHENLKMVTGCVATAMAQIMNYHHYPDKGTGSHSYNVNYTDLGLVTYSSDFENHIYDWGNMADSYTYGYTDLQADAVALLMKDCGVSVNMEYTTYNSGAYQYDMLQALKNYFSYSQDTYYQYRYGVTRDAWMEKVYSELDNGHPIAYRGNAGDGNGGHAFVLDGYDEDGNVHVNWGWSGDGDGFFDIDALNPSSYNFSYDQAMVVPIPGNRKSSYDLIYYVDGVLYKKYKVNVGDAITAEPFPTKAGHTFTGWSDIPEAMPNYCVLVYGTFVDEENIDGHEYVDLALPSGKAWSKVNYGASAETDYGSYLDWDRRGAVSQSWGAQWTTPTKTEFQELIDNCTWTWEPRDGINGYKVTGKNGNSIFLPAAGYHWGSYDQSVNSRLYYWTDTKASYSDAYALYATSTIYKVNSNSTIMTDCPIRPVSQIPADKRRYALTYVVDGEEYKTIYLKEGEAITPEPYPAKEGYTFLGWSEIPEVMPANDVTIMGMFKKDHFELFASDIKGYSGKTVALPVMIENSSEVKLFQFDLRLPEGITVAVTDEQTLDVVLKERAENHIMKGKQLSNGDYRFVVYSLDNESFEGEEGTLMEIKLAVSPEMNDAEYKIMVLNTEFCVVNSKGFRPVRPAEKESNLTVNRYLLGDANDDDAVNVADIVEIVNYILEKPSERFLFGAADVNADEEVNVTDIVKVVNIIISGNSKTSAAYFRRAAGMSDLAQYTAAQFELSVPDGTDVGNIRLVENMRHTHQLVCQQKSANTYMVLVYSLTNEPMKPENGKILESDGLTDAVVMKDMIVVTPTGDIAYYETASATTDIRMIENGHTPAVIYDLKGRRIDSAKKPDSGVYIINNKKYIAK